MDFEFVVDHVKAEVGMDHRADAERAVAEFLEVLAEGLDRVAAVSLAVRLPMEVRPVLGADHGHPHLNLDGLIAHLSEHMQLDPSVALHLAKSAAAAIAAALDDDARRVLRAHLDASVAALFDGPFVEHVHA